MSDHLGLITAIHQQPDDDLPRLAYADWLEENGDGEHAEFVRVELRLARLKRDHFDYRGLFERELQLIRAHKDRWFGTWREGWSGYEVRRGFIEEINARSPSALLPCADWLYDHHALQDLWVQGRWLELRSLLRHPLAGVVARMGLNGPAGAAYWPAGALRRDLPLERRPLALWLCGHDGGTILVEDLLASPHLHRVAGLNLSANALGPSGMRRLLDGLGALPRLRALNLSGRSGGPTNPEVANVGPEGISVLARHHAAAQLEEIDLSCNRLDGATVTALVRSRHLGAVTRLRLGSALSREDQRRLRQRFGHAIELPRGE